MKLLFFYTNNSPFVDKDIEIFKKQFILNQYRFVVKSKLFLPLELIKQKVFLLLKIFTADLIVCQFGGYHSLLPVLFALLTGKKSLIITGGVDCVSYPSFNYGYLHKFPLGLFTRWSYRLASHIAPKHESLILSDDNYYGADSLKQGIKPYIPKLTTPFTVIHNGYDSRQWLCRGVKKKKTFLTVCGGLEYPFQKQLKGIDLILDVAKHFPECEFSIIGVTPEIKIKLAAEHNLSANLRFIVPQLNAALTDFYCESEFYLQLSISEGFPNALCEAMLCNCIPIVSAVGAMPEIVGDTGFILKKRQPEMLKQLIEKALEAGNKDMAERARMRISENYTLAKREKKLLRLAEQLINPKTSLIP